MPKKTTQQHLDDFWNALDRYKKALRRLKYYTDNAIDRAIPTREFLISSVAMHYAFADVPDRFHRYLNAAFRSCGATHDTARSIIIQAYRTIEDMEPDISTERLLQMTADKCKCDYELAVEAITTAEQYTPTPEEQRAATAKRKP